MQDTITLDGVLYALTREPVQGERSEMPFEPAPMRPSHEMESVEALYSLRGQVRSLRQRSDMPCDAVAALRQAGVHIDQALAVVLRDNYGSDRVPRALRKADPCPTSPRTPHESPST